MPVSKVTIAFRSVMCFSKFINSIQIRPSSIGVGGTRPFFYMVDQYFGNDSLEPFECIFMVPLAL